MKHNYTENQDTKTTTNNNPYINQTIDTTQMEQIAPNVTITQDVQNPQMAPNVDNLATPQNMNNQQMQNGFVQNQPNCQTPNGFVTQPNYVQNGYTQNQQPQNGFVTQQNPYANPYYNTNGVNNQNPYINANPNQTQPQTQKSNSTFGLNNKFLIGLAVGGAAAWLLTNENAQKTIIKTGVKLFSKIGGGVEELKEKIMDAKAEIEAES